MFLTLQKLIQIIAQSIIVYIAIFKINVPFVHLDGFQQEFFVKQINFVMIQIVKVVQWKIIVLNVKINFLYIMGPVSAVT